MLLMYKLVNQKYQTYNNTKWKVGVKVVAKGKGNSLCTNALLHCYSNPYLAVLFNYIHANIQKPRLIEVECSPIIANDGLKQGCKEQTMIQELPLPQLTALERVEFAIRCSLLVYKEQSYVRWAKAWLSGVDRSKEKALAIYNDAAVVLAAAAAAYAAYSAAYAADAAAAVLAADAAVVLAADADADAAAAILAADADAAAAVLAADAARFASTKVLINKKFIAIITNIINRRNND